MAKIIAFANQKGGVGKTTSTINLAASLAATERNVLVIDLDPQGNATMASGVDKYALKNSVYDLLVEDNSIEDVLIRNTAGKYDLVGANGDLTAAEIKLMDSFAREMKLKNALEPVKDIYDFILIDCPPSLNLLTINAMAASNSVIIPMQCEYFALEGLTALLDTINKLTSVLNSNLVIEGLLRTMFDPRNKLANEVSQQLKSHFGSKVFRTIIPRNVRLAESPSHGLPAIFYDKYSNGAKAYLALAGELLRKYDSLDQTVING